MRNFKIASAQETWYKIRFFSFDVYMVYTKLSSSVHELNGSLQSFRLLTSCRRGKVETKVIENATVVSFIEVRGEFRFSPSLICSRLYDRLWAGACDAQTVLSIDEITVGTLHFGLNASANCVASLEVRLNYYLQGGFDLRTNKFVASF